MGTCLAHPPMCRRQLGAHSGLALGRACLAFNPLQTLGLKSSTINPHEKPKPSALIAEAATYDHAAGRQKGEGLRFLQLVS